MSEKDVCQRLDRVEKKLSEVYQFIPAASFSATVQSAGDEIDLLELLRVIWQGKWVITLVTFFFLVVSIVYVKSLPNIYKSEVLLAPAEENSGGGLMKMAGQLGGLANLAGINLGGGGSDKTALAIEVLKSRDFLSGFVERRDILVPLLGVKGWDSVSDKLIVNESVFDSETGRWVRRAVPSKLAVPSPQGSFEALTRILEVSQDKTTGFVKVSIEHYSPRIAKQWVDWLVEDINLAVRRRDVSQAEKSIRFLKKQMGKVSIAEMQGVFYELIEEQTKIIMFAEVRDEYVFKTIDSAVVPEKKVKPKKALIVILVTMLGGVLSVLLVFVMWLQKKSKKIED